MPPTIVILDDEPDRLHEMRWCLQNCLPDCTPFCFDNAPEMILWLGEHLEEANLICLDHDLGPNRKLNGVVFDPGTGRDVVDYLATKKPTCPILIHTSNSLAAPGMELALDDSGWMHFRTYPENDLQWIHDYWIKDVIDVLNKR